MFWRVRFLLWRWFGREREDMYDIDLDADDL